MPRNREFWIPVLVFSLGVISIIALRSKKRVCFDEEGLGQESPTWNRDQNRNQAIDIVEEASLESFPASDSPAY